MVEKEYHKKIKQYEKDYMDFMGIEEFPEYKIEFYEIKLEETDLKGYGAAAQAMYDYKTGKHTLRVCNNLELKEYVVFHEFTHILDSELYVKGDPNKHVCLSGYTEYHASQVELMRLLGAKKISDVIAKKELNTIISTFPYDRTILNYIHSKHQFVADMMSRDGFPINSEALIYTLGVMYNYWGLRSICKMYVNGYQEAVNNSSIVNIIPLHLFKLMDGFMDGWFNESQIEMCMGLYSNVLIPILQEKKWL